jgi:carboxymethylenebutenolidase
MDLVKEWTEYSSQGEGVSCYRVRPSASDDPLPAVVVIQEIWGPDEHICDVCERFAAAGYLALAPDLYSRGGRPQPLAPERIEATKSFLNTVPPRAWMDPTQREQALAKLGDPQAGEIKETLDNLFPTERPIARYTQDVGAAVDFVRSDPQSAGRVGSIGFCLGGGLSAQLACSDPNLDAAVIFYGASPDADRLSAVECPVMGFYGGEDARITDGVPAFAEAMKQAGKSFEHFVYPGAPHAFFNDTRASFRVDPARDAWAKTLSFFVKNLSGPGLTA